MWSILIFTTSARRSALVSRILFNSDSSNHPPPAALCPLSARVVWHLRSGFSGVQRICSEKLPHQCSLLKKQGSNNHNSWNVARTHRGGLPQYQEWKETSMLLPKGSSGYEKIGPSVRKPNHSGGDCYAHILFCSFPWQI